MKEDEPLTERLNARQFALAQSVRFLDTQEYLPVQLKGRSMVVGMLSRITDHIDRQGRLMAGMMERLDVDVASFANDAMGIRTERAARACAFCRHGDACERWQAAHPQSAAQAPAFCPNRAFWAAHRHE